MANNYHDNTSVATLSREMEIELMTAMERDDDTLLVAWLERYPAMTDDIIAFVAALRVIDTPDFTPTADVDVAVNRGIAKGLARVAFAATAGVPAGASARDLNDALKASGLSKSAAARKTQIGVDVLQKLLQGRITIATIPQRFFERLGQALGGSLEQARQWAERSFEAGPQVQPALRRGSAHVQPTESTSAPESFSDAVQRSPNMSHDDKTSWLA
jgi:hypothetical protein